MGTVALNDGYVALINTELTRHTSIFVVRYMLYNVICMSTPSTRSVSGLAPPLLPRHLSDSQNHALTM